MKRLRIRTPLQKLQRAEKDRADRSNPAKREHLRALESAAYGRSRARQAAWSPDEVANERAKRRIRHRSWGKGTPRGIVQWASASARLRGLDFTISESDIRIPEICPVLGLHLDPRAGNRADNLPSLDRFDPSVGYVPGNVWVISWKANILKHNASLSDLEALVRAMKLHQFRSRSHAWLRRTA